MYCNRINSEPITKTKNQTELYSVGDLIKAIALSESTDGLLVAGEDDIRFIPSEKSDTEYFVRLDYTEQYKIVTNFFNEPNSVYSPDEKILHYIQIPGSQMPHICNDTFKLDVVVFKSLHLVIPINCKIKRSLFTRFEIFSEDVYEAEQATRDFLISRFRNRFPNLTILSGDFE